jgi:23S rRNA (uracil1939-C5)-methyltransferase
VTRKKVKPFYESVTITDIGAEGKSIARVGEKVVFTTHAVPGDVVDLQVTASKRRFEEARVVRYHQYSSERSTPFCRHFGLCGGCSWQNLPYQLQLRYKQKQVTDQLQRIGKLELPEILPILGSARTIQYRNKLEFTFSNNRWLTQEEMDRQTEIDERNALGFHVPGMFDKVFRVEECWLQADPSNAIRNFLFRYALLNRLSFFDLRAQTGFLRNVIIRNSTTGELMVIMVFFHEWREAREALLQALAENFPGISSLMYIINSKRNDTITDQEVILYSGKDHITEELDGMKFRVGPKSFYQTNSEQAAQLYRQVKDFAGLNGNENVFDLYSGTGTIACYLAGSCKKVVGIEYVPEAIEDAGINSAINGLTNTFFASGDIRKVMNPAFLEFHGKPDVIIADPPRSGMHEDVVSAIVEASPQKVVYVSCNPATQARDLALMSSAYSVEKVQPVDMFPHTYHVENIVLLKKRNSKRYQELRS